MHTNRAVTVSWSIQTRCVSARARRAPVCLCACIQFACGNKWCWARARTTLVRNEHTASSVPGCAWRVYFGHSNYRSRLCTKYVCDPDMHGFARMAVPCLFLLVWALCLVWSESQQPALGGVCLCDKCGADGSPRQPLWQNGNSCCDLVLDELIGLL